jgi:hypothetical protein
VSLSSLLASSRCAAPSLKRNLPRRRLKQVWKHHVHDNKFRSESAGCNLVLESAEEIFLTDFIELGVVLKGVDDALALDGVCALGVELGGEEELLATWNYHRPPLDSSGR